MERVNLEPSQIEAVAAVLIAEAGGETNRVEAMTAVCEVIRTRCKERKQTPLEVVVARKQFSCLNKTTIDALIVKSKKHKAWAKACEIAAGPETQLTKGANHYCAGWVVKQTKWARERTPVVMIGRHVFYKL